MDNKSVISSATRKTNESVTMTLRNSVRINHKFGHMTFVHMTYEESCHRVSQDS